MSKRRLVITAVLAGASQSEVARTYGVSQGWVSRLMARYRDEGEAAFEPRSRRPLTSPAASAASVVGLVLRLRQELAGQGLDAGADSVGWHLTHRHQVTVSRATIHRILVRAGAVTPDPSERPKSSYIRFKAAMPNECWVRKDRLDNSGTVTLRVAGRMRHIPTGRTHARTPVILLVHDLEVRVINAATGELLRELTIDLTRDYQPLGRPPGPPPNNTKGEPPK